MLRRRSATVRPRPVGRLEQPVHLRLAQEAGQGPCALRPPDQRRRIVLAPAFEKPEAVELPDRREPPGAGRLGHAPVGLVDEIGLDLAAPRRLERSAGPGKEFGKIGQIAGIG